MTYRLEWRLLGRERRLLDSGEIDTGFPDRRSALEALGAFLLPFAIWSRDEADGSWLAKRSADADITVQVMLREQVPSLDDAMPALWATRTGEPASLAA